MDLLQCAGGDGMRMHLCKDFRGLAVVALLAHVAGEGLASLGLGTDAWSGLGEGGLFLAWAIGHCGGMHGPVVTLARRAMDTGDVNLVLPWVRRDDETQVRQAFEHVMAVRKLGPQARELADLHFFETPVRVHRAAEGAAYDGLKPAGRDLGPAIPAPDHALERGPVDEVFALLADAVRKGVRQHFENAVQHRKFDVDDVAAGRRYVRACVPYVHYVERLWQATGAAHGHHAAHGAGHAHRIGGAGAPLSAGAAGAR